MKADSAVARSTPEVIVLGGGPAGCAAGASLARHGHDVLLVTRRRARERALAESLPPSSRKLLAATGLLGAIEEAGFFRNGGNTVWWAGEPERVETFGGTPGFQVDALRLEQVALDVARAAGVRIVEAGARSARADGDGWTVDGPGFAARTRWLIDATGRAGVVARQGLRIKDDRPRTLALVARWRGAWDAAESSHTLVESYRDGWAWSVPLAPTLRCVTAMVDPDATELDRSGDLAATCLAELRKTVHIRARLASATLHGRVWACPASTHTARPFARPGLLLVGDAGSFIDPLSSFGVKKALASAWLAAIVVHSALAEPAITLPALELFDRREREMFERYSALSHAFHAEAARFHRHAFWQRRALGGGEDVTAEARTGALREIQQRETPDLVPGPSLRVVKKAVVSDDRIVLADVPATDSEPGGIDYVHGVDMRRLITAAPGSRDVPALHAAVARDVPMPDFLAALAFAIARGFLRHGG